MRIIIYGINYAPELTGIGKYTGEMCSWLARNGHDVTVITSKPYYPEWSIHSNYKAKWWLIEEIDGVKVYRCPLYVPAQVTSIKRIIHEFSFVAGILPIWIKSFFKKKFDIIISISPPFHIGVLPLIYAKLRGSKLVTHVQDLQVDAAKELGMITNKKFLGIMFALEHYILNNSDAVTTISPGMKSKIVNKGISNEPVLFPNWVDEMTLFPLSSENSLRQEFGISQTDKVVLYSGNLGEKQGLEIIPQVAARFAERADVHFLIVGSGGARQKLESMVTSLNLKNVKFFPLQPYHKLSSLLATADLHLILQKKSASDLVMPSKLTGILAIGGCALVTASPGSTLFNVIKEHNLGILVAPESADELYFGVKRALDEDLTIYKKNSRRYAEHYLSKESILRKFETELLKLL